MPLNCRIFELIAMNWQKVCRSDTVCSTICDRIFGYALRGRSRLILGTQQCHFHLRIFLQKL